MMTFTGQREGGIASECKLVLNHFKQGTKRDASAYTIFKNNLNHDTFYTEIFLENHQGTRTL